MKGDKARPAADLIEREKNWQEKLFERNWYKKEQNVCRLGSQYESQLSRYIHYDAAGVLRITRVFLGKRRQEMLCNIYVLVDIIYAQALCCVAERLDRIYEWFSSSSLENVVE